MHYHDRFSGPRSLFFDQACALDLEGIVAKLASAPYRATQPRHWVKIKNPDYTQADGRHEFFEPLR